MKLSSVRVERAVNQFEANPIPENHPAIPQLNQAFGEHTFLLNGNGLHIVEPVEPTPTGDEAGKVVKLASWSDEDRTSLTPHQPQPTDVVIVLGSEEEDASR